MNPQCGCCSTTPCVDDELFSDSECENEKTKTCDDETQCDGCNDGCDDENCEVGPMGPQGIAGLSGPQGSEGLLGSQGNTGQQGTDGTGPQGQPGTDGTGPQGQPGTDGTGPQGEQGQQGIFGPQGGHGGPQGYIYIIGRFLTPTPIPEVFGPLPTTVVAPLNGPIVYSSPGWSENGGEVKTPQSGVYLVTYSVNVKAGNVPSSLIFAACFVNSVYKINTDSANVFDPNQKGTLTRTFTGFFASGDLVSIVLTSFDAGCIIQASEMSPFDTLNGVGPNITLNMTLIAEL